MKPLHVIFALLIVAFALGDLASLGYVEARHQRWPDLPGIILLGMVFSQLTLVAAWFTFARANIVLRLLIMLAAVFWLALVAAVATDGSDSTTQWFPVQLLALGCSAVPMWLTKLAGWRMILEGEVRAATRLPARQFSIWGLLSGMTAVAIALGAARHVDMPLLAVGEAIAFFGSLAAIGLLVFFLSMGLRVPAVATMVTLPAVAILCPLGGMLIGMTGLPPDEHPVRWALFGFCYGATIASAVLALRIAGLRLTRCPLKASPAAGAAKDELPFGANAGNAQLVQPAKTEPVAAHGATQVSEQ